MGKYIIKRVLYILLVFMILSFLIFMIYNMLPIDKASERATEDAKLNRGPNPAEYRQDRNEDWQRQLGTDGTKIERYFRWLGLMARTKHPDGTGGGYHGLLQGNFGDSAFHNKPVIELVIEPMKNTIFINIFATILALGITLPLGIFCAVKRGSKRDTAVQVGTLIGYSIPTFIIAIVFIWLFAVVLGWFPVAGMETAGSINWSPARQFWDRMYHLALPLIVMTFCSLGGMTRYVRAAMIEALSMDCIRTARAKGLREKVVIYSHAWRNALLPVVTLIIGWFLGIFGGSLMIENIFALNGIGRIYNQSLMNNDNEVVLALQMFYITLSLFGNLLIDLVYGLVDPRVRVNK